MLVLILFFLAQLIKTGESSSMKSKEGSTTTCLVVLDSCSNFDQNEFTEYKYIECTEPSNINNKLQGINQDSDSLEIFSGSSSIAIDLQNLNHQVSVIISKKEENGRLKLLNKNPKKSTMIKNRIGQYKTNSHSITKEELPSIDFTVDIIGSDIREKVSSLTLYQCSLLVSGSDLTANDISLLLSSISSETKVNIIAPNIITDQYSFTNIIQNSFLKGQFILYIIGEIFENIKIEFTNDMWSIQINDAQVTDPTSLQIGYQYFTSNKLFLWVSSNNYEFNVNDAAITKANPINITIIDLPTKINVITSGTWDSINEVDIYFTALHNLVEINTENCNEKVKIIKEYPYGFENNQDSSESDSSLTDPNDDTSSNYNDNEIISSESESSLNDPLIDSSSNDITNEQTSSDNQPSDSSSNYIDNEQISSNIQIYDSSSDDNQNDWTNSGSNSIPKDSNYDSSNDNEISNETSYESESDYEDIYPIPPSFDDGDPPFEPESQPLYNNPKYISIKVTNDAYSYGLCLSSLEDFNNCRDHPDESEGNCFTYSNIVDVICINNSEEFNTKLESIQPGYLLSITTSMDIPYINLSLIKEKINISFTREYYTKENVQIGLSGGDYQDKISNIIFADLNVKVSNYPLIIDSLILEDSNITSDSQNVQSINLILDKKSYELMNFSKVQYEYLVLRFEILPQRHFVISFENDKWNVFTRIHGNDDFKLYYSVPYTLTEKLNLVKRAHFFEFYVRSDKITKVKDVNISLLDPNYVSENISYSSPGWKYQVKFLNYGDWEGITEKLSVYFSYYTKFVNIENNCDSNVNLINVPFYDPIPDATPEATARAPYPEDNSYQPELKPISEPYIEMYVFKSAFECNYYKNMLQKCKENPKDEDCYDFDIEDSPSDIICVSNANNINNELAKITSNDNLDIITEMDIPNIDLSQLKSKRSVTIKSSMPDESKLLSKTVKLKRKLESKDDIIFTIGIQGNIKEKVSKLIFTADIYSPKMNIKVLSSPLNVESFELNKCLIDDDSELIHTNNMLTNIDSFYLLFLKLTDKMIRTKLLSLYIPSSGARMYQISFENLHWNLLTKWYFSDDEYSPFLKIPYSICSRFNLITVSHFFDLNLANGNVYSLKPINITILQIQRFHEYSPVSHLLEDSDKKYLVKLTSSGEWDKIDKTVSVYFTSYQDYVKLEENCNSKLEVLKFNFNEDGSLTPPAPDDDEDLPVFDSNFGPFQPPFSQFTYSAQLIVSNDKETCDGVKKGYDYCKKNPTADGCYLFESINYYSCTSPQNLNNELANVPSDGDSLSILTFTNLNDIDFNKLSHKMTVHLSYQNDDERLKLLSSNISLANKLGIKSKLNRKSNKRVKDSSALIGIKGNIKDKVPFLVLERASIQILESPLNIENLYLKACTIQENSQKIQVTHLIADGVSHKNILLYSENKIDAKQYALKSYDIYDSDVSYNPNNKYRITFGNNNWTIESSDTRIEYYMPFFPIDEGEIPSDFPDDYPINVPSYVPYGLCERFAFIMPSNYFELYADSDKAKPINITIMNLDSLLLDTVNFPVSLTTAGNWDRITEPLSVYVTTFKNLVDIHTSGCDSKVQVTQFDAYNPIIITDSSSRDDKEAGQIDISGKDQGKIKEEIDKLFNKTDEGDQYVTINNADEVTSFTNLELKPNEFIKLQDNAKVTLSGGNLNLLLDNSSSVNINVDNNNDVKLSIKNKAECTVNIDTKSNEVIINSNSEVYNNLKLTVPDNVNNIKINSVNLHNSGSISATSNNDPNKAVTVIVDNLQAQAQTSGKLKKVEVANEFTISETASIELDDVTLNNAKINLNLHSYSYPNYVLPMLSGNLGKPPNEIKINKPTNGKTEPSTVEKNKEFLIFQGTFSPDCEQWKNALNLTDIYFNTGECIPISGTLDETKSLVMKFVSDGNKDPNKGGNKNKLSSAQIAGIVIGIVVGVAIIVIIVVIVIIKKKKKQQNSSAESGNEQTEL